MQQGLCVLALAVLGESRGSRGGSWLGSYTALQRDSLTLCWLCQGPCCSCRGGVHGAAAAGAGAVHCSAPTHPACALAGAG